MRLTPRKRLLVDPKLQGSLLLRTFGYWCFSVITISLVLLCMDALSGPPRPFLRYFRFDTLWQEHGTVMIAALVMLPILLVDMLMTSNRVAGPLYRLRRSLRALAAGEYVERVQFRDSDFWHGMAAEFNAVVAYVERLKRGEADTNGPEKSHEIELEPLNRR